MKDFTAQDGVIDSITIGTGYCIETVASGDSRKLVIYHPDRVKTVAAFDALEASSSFRGLSVNGCWFNKERKLHYLLVSPSSFYKVTPQHRHVAIGLLSIANVIDAFSEPPSRR